MNIYYVYTLKVSNEELPFYVGKGKGNRIGEHVRQAKRNEKSFKCNKIRKALALGYQIVAEKVFESSDEQACFNTEIELIRKYGRRDIGTGILVNQTDGGDGSSGFVMSTDQKEKLSRVLQGRMRSDEHRKSISRSTQGHRVNEETRRKLSEKNKGKKLTENQKQKLRQSLIGHPTSAKTRRRIGDAHRGREKTEQHRQKISATLKGRKRPVHAVDKGAKYTRREACEHIKAQMQSGLSQNAYYG